MTINSATGLISWIPNSTQTGNTTVVVLAGDGKDTASQTWTIYVASVNDTPQINLMADNKNALTVYEDTAVFTLVLSSVNISDTNSTDTIGALNVTVLNNDLVKVSVDKSSGSQHILSFMVFKDVYGVDTMTIRVTDMFGAYSEQNFVLTILNVNDTPIITSTPVTNAIQNNLYSYQVTATDTDNQVIGYQLSCRYDNRFHERINFMDTEFYANWKYECNSSC